MGHQPSGARHRPWWWRPERPLALLLGASAVIASLASVAMARPVHAVATQGGRCDAFTGAVQLGTAAYQDSHVIVPACGPKPGRGDGHSIRPYPTATLPTDGYQCVELSERFIFYKYGLAQPTISTNGDQIVDHYGSKYPDKFVVEDALKHVPLAQGDVLSFSSDPLFASDSGGHTAVVQASDINASGTGSVTIIEQNAYPTGTEKLHVAGWAIQGTPFAHIKWLHPKGAAPPPPGSGAAGRGLDLVFAIDTTGSMSPYIQSVVTASSFIVDALDVARANYRVGVVDYKDSDFGCANYDAVIDLPFSTSRTAIESALSGLVGKVGGGCDIPEDVYSGIHLALHFPWRKGVTKAVIFMGDAPGHDPEPHSGLTLAAIKAEAFAVDPAQVYSILVGPDPDAHAFDKAVAAATGGQTFDATSDPSLAGGAFVTAIETILTTLEPSAISLKSDVGTVAPGAPAHLTATVTPATDSGSVTFVDNGDPMVVCHGQPLSSAGVAQCDATFAAAGTHQISAVFTGNDSLADSTSNVVTLVVAAPPTTPPPATTGEGGTPFTGGPDPPWQGWLLLVLALGLALTTGGAVLRHWAGRR